jgi:SAM-dependent methyltransferase
LFGQSVRAISWGKHTRVVLDVGCGVASFGGYLFERDVATMSFAPKDEHEAQVQMALERGIPAISAVMGSKRLPFPSKSFDLVHCARCRVPWHTDGAPLPRLLPFSVRPLLTMPTEIAVCPCRWRSPPRTEPRPAPRRVLRLVRHAGVPEANGGRRDLERHVKFRRPFTAMTMNRSIRVQSQLTGQLS